jgi:hypothetical protein
LSRWGSSIGFSGGVDAPTSLGSTKITDDGKAKAEKLLEHILNLFVEAEKTSAEFKKREMPRRSKPSYTRRRNGSRSTDGDSPPKDARSLNLATK